MEQKLANDWLTELKGKSYNNKNRDSAYSYLLEEKKKVTNPAMSETCIAYNVSKENEILGVGGSCPDDLVLDNFGRFFSLMMGQKSSTNTDNKFQMKDDGGTLRDYYMYYSAENYMWNYGANTHTTGMHLKIGKGTTAPARSDYAIETPFAAGAESEYIAPTNNIAAWSSAAGKISQIYMLQGTSSADSISEAGLFFYGHYATSYTYDQYWKYSMMTHDQISPVVNFSAGDTVILEYVWNL